MVVVVLAAAAAVLRDKVADEVDGNGEDDGRVLLGRDGAQGLKKGVAQSLK